MRMLQSKFFLYKQYIGILIIQVSIKSGSDVVSLLDKNSVQI